MDNNKYTDAFDMGLYCDSIKDYIKGIKSKLINQKNLMKQQSKVDKKEVLYHLLGFQELAKLIFLIRCLKER